MGIKLGLQEIVFGVFILLFAVCSLFLDGFFAVQNMLTLVQNVSLLGILGLAAAIVVIGRGIDLSLIAVFAVPPGLLLHLVNGGTPLSLAILAALGFAALFGAINGWLIAYAEVPAIFATLASGIFLAGFGQAVIFDLNIIPWSDGMAGFEWLGQGRILGVPVQVLIFVAMAVIVGIFLRRTRYGAGIYALGDNLLAARLIGLPVRPTIVLQFVLAALIGCFAGFILAASVNSMPTRVFNSTMIYDVILVVVLGGIGLSGGRGGAINVVLGTLLIGTMLNALTIMNMPYAAQNLIKGFVLLFAVGADSLLNPRNEETAQQGDI